MQIFLSVFISYYIRRILSRDYIVNPPFTVRVRKCIRPLAMTEPRFYLVNISRAWIISFAPADLREFISARNRKRDALPLGAWKMDNAFFLTCFCFCRVRENLVCFFCGNNLVIALFLKGCAARDKQRAMSKRAVKSFNSSYCYAFVPFVVNLAKRRTGIAFVKKF